MRIRIESTLVSLVLVALSCAALASDGRDPGDAPWQQYARPSQGGFDAEDLAAVRHQAEQLGTGALLIVRNGVVVEAWGDVERKFKCHSVRKSFLSALYGNPVAKGEIDLQATIGGLGIDDIQPLTELEKTATVEQLLQARSGIFHPAAKEPRSMKTGRPSRGSARPGERFWYNNWDFNTAGYIFELATGRGIFDAFAEDLAGPLGMEDFEVGDTFYQFERKSSRVPAYAFRLSARDAARFGLLYLQDGRWSDRQLVPSEWIERSVRTHSDLGEQRGYGYMWWTYGPGTMASRPDLTAFAASGTGGQLIAVIPALDLLLVHRADTDFGRGVGSGDVWGLVRGIVEAIDGPAQPTESTIPLEKRPFAKSLPELRIPKIISLPVETLDRYAGTYRVSPEVTVSVRRMDDFLIGEMTGAGEGDFFATSETEFWGRAVGARVRFELDEARNVTAATIWYRGQEMRALPE